jgi:tetratricopeptide (TPR) repeat protein
MKVFLSHSAKDKDFVEKLAAAMTAAGFESWLCEIDVEKNDNFVIEIEKGLVWCDVALLVWSPEAAGSKWTTVEWTSVLHREVTEQRVRLGIVMLRKQALPQLLQTKNYISAHSDQPMAIRETIAWLQRRESVQRFSGEKAPVFLPDYRPQDFVGRGAQLELLRTAFGSEPTVFLLQGEPGSGKSTLALQFAWEAQREFDAVIFQTCGGRSLDSITAELVDRLPIDAATLPPDGQREAAKRWLRERQSLLVLDDVQSIDVLQLAPGPGCSVLYTSRLQSLPGVSPKSTSKVGSFTKGECTELFHAFLDPTFSAEEVTKHGDALLDFASKVDRLPIAVAVGATLLQGKAASRLDRGALKLRLDALSDGLHDVNALFTKAIESQAERERKLLAACAMCAQEGFWLPLAAQIAQLDESHAEDAASTLVHGSLLRALDRERQRFQLHALLREQIKVWAGADGVTTQQARHAVAVEQLFKDWDTRWRECHECLDEILPAARYLWEQGQTDREELLTQWGYMLTRRTGELALALRIVQQQEAFWVERDDRDARQMLPGNYSNQALILREWGQFEEAFKLYQKAEAISRESHDLETLQAVLGNQAVILHQWGYLKEAMEQLQEKEAICIALRLPGGLQTSYGNQALILQDLGMLDKAMALLKKQATICRKIKNKDDLQKNYGNQATIYLEQKEPKKAMPLLRKQEALCLELGNKESLQRALANQAAVLNSLRRFPPALELLKRSEAICIELGLRRDLAYCYYYWGVVAQARGDKATEKQKLELALAMFTELKMPRESEGVRMSIAVGQSADRARSRPSRKVARGAAPAKADKNNKKSRKK